MRYKHHLLLPEIGGQGQKALGAAKVVVIGAGGLGCPILSYLAGAGVGEIVVIDGDRVELSNLQRQTLYTEADIGLPKAEVATRRLGALNGEIILRPVAQMFGADTPADILEGAGLIIEGTDRIAARHVVNRAALKTRLPLISSAASRFSGYVGRFCEPDGPCYACFVPEGADEEGMCDRDGVLGPVVGMVGSLAASEAISLLVGDGGSARTLSLVGMRPPSLRQVEVERDPDCPVCGKPR
jgi:adenylyltransferase/sulfurtransferase